jgi:hypothetical protein
MAMGSPRTSWGGKIVGRVQPRRYFQVEQRDSIWWLVDPDGGLFLSKGINVVRCDADRIRDSDRIPYLEACRRKYGSDDAWRAAAARRLLSWGFNSLGAWSDEAVAVAGSSPLAFTETLDIGAKFNERSGSVFPDVFHPDFEFHARRSANEGCLARRTDPQVIGWFTDNELRWGPDWRGPDELLTIFLNLPNSSPGHCAAIEMLRERYGDFDAFNAIWHIDARSWDEFARTVPVTAPYSRKPVYERNEADELLSNEADARRAQFIADCEQFAGKAALLYFEATKRAVEAADPNHLVLGCRFAYRPPPSVIEAAGCNVDVVSFNCYEIDPTAAIDAYAGTGKPCMISEFSFLGRDSGLPNTIGAGPRVATQADRARCLRDFVAAGLSRAMLVGYHWFQHADQPSEGRSDDGENSNYGVVTIADDIYQEITRSMAAVNADAERLHSVASIGSGSLPIGPYG